MDTFLEENAANCAAGGGHNDCAVEGSKELFEKCRGTAHYASRTRDLPLTKGMLYH